MKRELVKMFEEYFVYKTTKKKVRVLKLKDFEKQFGWGFVPFSDYYDWFKGFCRREYATLVWIETRNGEIIRAREEKIRRYADEVEDWHADGESIEECLKRHNLRKEDIVRIIVNEVVYDDNDGVYEEEITIYE